jgi:hypothetical protein
MDKLIHRLLTHNSEENWIRTGTNRPKDKETKRQRDKETKRQRNKETKKQRDKETNIQINKQTKKPTDEENAETKNCPIERLIKKV